MLHTKNEKNPIVDKAVRLVELKSLYLINVSDDISKKAAALVELERAQKQLIDSLKLCNSSKKTKLKLRFGHKAV